MRLRPAGCNVSDARGAPPRCVGAGGAQRVGGLGHRGLADRRRGRRRATRAVAPAHRTRVVSQDRHAGRRVCDRARLAGHPRAVRGRGDREGPGRPLQPSPASPSAPARRGRGRLLQRLVCDRRGAAAACTARRRADRAGPAADASGRADAAGRHRTARVAVAADGLGRGALAPVTAAVGGAVVARREGHAGRRAARRGPVRHGQRVQRAGARCPGQNRHRESACRRHDGGRRRRMARRCANARDGPGRTWCRRQGCRRPGRGRRRQPPARGEAERVPLGA